MGQEKEYEKIFKLKSVDFGVFPILDEALNKISKEASTDTLDSKKYFKRNKTHSSIIVNKNQKKVVCTIPLKAKDKMFIGTLHVLPLMYFNLCSDLINMYQTIIDYAYSNNKEGGEGIIISNDTYNTIISYKISAIIMLHTAIDASLNYIFPNEKVYYSVKAQKELNKLGFEDLPFMDRVKELFREVFNLNICDDKVYNIISEINTHRTNLIHINATQGKMNLERYFEELGASVNIDLKSYHRAVVDLFVKVRPDLFAVDTNAPINHSQVNTTNSSIYYPILNNVKL